MITKHRMIVTSLIGLFLATFGVLYVVYLDTIFRFTLRKFLTLKPNSMITNLWESPTLIVTVDLYIFNWTNPEDFNNRAIKPKFEELGPYRFVEKAKKIHLTWHPENSTVSYLRRSNFYYDAEGSAGNLDDVIIAPNMLAASLYKKVKHWSTMKQSLIDIALKMSANDATIERSADEWLFTGFDTALLRLGKLVPISIPDLDLPYEKIGYGYPRNSSTEVYGHHNVYTGAQDFSKIGQIATWRYSQISKVYPKCGKIRGSTGEFHPVPLQKGVPISYFLPDLCRELQIDYDGPTSVQDIDGYRYVGSAKNMANGTDNELNRCYCSDNCDEIRSGLMNISSCWYDAPVFASYPHFYKADPYYAEQIEGMQPDPERHELSVVLEPNTGLVLDLKARLMLSLLVEPMQHSSLFRNARRTFFPLIWADYRTQISPELANYMKMLPIVVIVCKIFSILCIAFGVVLMIWYPKKLYCRPQYMREIEISSHVESRGKSHTQERIKSFPEGSPLLVGLEYIGKIQRLETDSNRTITPSELTQSGTLSLSM